MADLDLDRHLAARHVEPDQGRLALGQGCRGRHQDRKKMPRGKVSIEINGVEGNENGHGLVVNAPGGKDALIDPSGSEEELSGACDPDPSCIAKRVRAARRSDRVRKRFTSKGMAAATFARLYDTAVDGMTATAKANTAAGLPWTPSGSEEELSGACDPDPSCIAKRVRAARRSASPRRGWLRRPSLASMTRPSTA
jgi:hypothetical protein